MLAKSERFAPVNARMQPLLDRIARLKQEDIYFYFRQLEESSKAHTKVDGKDRIHLASNNYLGLAAHPKVAAAAMEALKRYGVGSGSSRILSGTMSAHRELEEKIAWFKGEEDCLVYSTGFMANLGLISSLVGPGDTVILDSLDHASIVDGARLSGAKMRIFKHNDMDDLQRKLAKTPREEDKVCLVVVDGVFSMDGDLTDLPTLVSLAREKGFLLMVDDAHGTGVLGRTGRGISEHFQLTGKVDIPMGTLSKALGSMGAFVVGDRDLITYLRNSSRPSMFNTSLPPSACAAAGAAIDVLLEEPRLLDDLRANAAYLRHGLQRLGFDTLDSTQTPIIPVLIGEDDKSMQITRYLFNHGILSSAVVWPACKHNSARLRMSVMATHTKKDLDCVLNAMADVHRLFGPFEYVRAMAAENFIGMEEEQDAASASA